MADPGESVTIADLLGEVENPAYKAAVTARILVGRAVALLDEHAEADRAAAAALDDDRTSNREPLALAAARRVQEIEEQIEAAKTPFRFVSIGRRAWADLVADHPPTKDDLKRDPRADIDPRTFPVAAIAASCTSPEMTAEDVERLEAAIDDSQWTALWDACLRANMGGTSTPKSVVAGSILRANERFATIAASGESPAASSSDE